MGRKYSPVAKHPGPESSGGGFAVFFLPDFRLSGLLIFPTFLKSPFLLSPQKPNFALTEKRKKIWIIYRV
jgi:hypothetical protein